MYVPTDANQVIATRMDLWSPAVNASSGSEEGRHLNNECVGKDSVYDLDPYFPRAGESASPHCLGRPLFCCKMMLSLCIQRWTSRALAALTMAGSSCICPRIAVEAAADNRLREQRRRSRACTAFTQTKTCIIYSTVPFPLAIKIYLN